MAAVTEAASTKDAMPKTATPDWTRRSERRRIGLQTIGVGAELLPADQGADAQRECENREDACSSHVEQPGVRKSTGRYMAPC